MVARRAGPLRGGVVLLMVWAARQTSSGHELGCPWDFNGPAVSAAEVGPFDGDLSEVL